jgi:hypothetical protein
MGEKGQPNRFPNHRELLGLLGSSARRLLRRDLLICAVLCASACLLAMYAFAKLGGVRGDALIVTGYAVEIPRNQQRTFGFGGMRRAADSQTSVYQTPDVLFQSPVMSAFSFAVSRDGDGALFVEGIDDRVSFGGEQYPPGTRVRVPDGSVFRSSGDYGGASFRLSSVGNADEVRLTLGSPIYYLINETETRVTFDRVHEFVSAPVDEIFIRAAGVGGEAGTYLLTKKAGGGFTLRKETDLTVPPPGTGEQPLEIVQGEPRRFGTVMVGAAEHAPVVFGWLNAGQIFGLKLAAVVALLAFAFGFNGFYPGEAGPRLPNGPLLFGSVAALAVVGLTLTGRDYFVPPINHARIHEYITWFFRALVVLFLLLVPLRSFYRWRWVAAWPVFLGVFCLLNEPFRGFISVPSLPWLIGFLVTYLVLGFVAHHLMLTIKRLTEYAVLIRWQGVIIALGLLVAVVLILTRVWGGHSAILIGGARIHIPTLLLPLITYGVSLAVITAEAEKTDWPRARALALTFIMLLIGAYYVVSEFDHGGTVVLVVGTMATAWAAARKAPPLLFTVVLAVLLAAAVVVASAYVHHERFEIAWGGEEGAQRYFDEAVNLRTARDMARAGGFFGLYEDLYVPSTLRMNIYNDLVAAYVAGFFGLLGLLLLMGAYVIFYVGLAEGLMGLVRVKGMRAKPDPRPAAPAAALGQRDMPPPVAPRAAAPVRAPKPVGSNSWRHALWAYVAGLTAALFFQCMWVLTATLWRRIPFSGLDLQPVSASVISVVTFVVFLLGSLAFLYNAQKRFAPKPGG